jgi:hypothetical protein
MDRIDARIKKILRGQLAPIEGSVKPSDFPVVARRAAETALIDDNIYFAEHDAHVRRRLDSLMEKAESEGHLYDLLNMSRLDVDYEDVVGSLEARAIALLQEAVYQIDFDLEGDKFQITRVAPRL